MGENLDSISYTPHKNLIVQVHVKDETIKLLENNSGQAKIFLELKSFQHKGKDW